MRTTTTDSALYVRLRNMLDRTLTPVAGSQIDPDLREVPVRCIRGCDYAARDIARTYLEGSEVSWHNILSEFITFIDSAGNEVQSEISGIANAIFQGDAIYADHCARGYGKRVMAGPLAAGIIVPVPQGARVEGQEQVLREIAWQNPLPTTKQIASQIRQGVDIIHKDGKRKKISPEATRKAAARISELFEVARRGLNKAA
jgi:hypothetical protein